MVCSEIFSMLSNDLESPVSSPQQHLYSNESSPVIAQELKQSPPPYITDMNFQVSSPQEHLYSESSPVIAQERKPSPPPYLTDMKFVKDEPNSPQGDMNPYCTPPNSNDGYWDNSEDTQYQIISAMLFKHPVIKNTLDNMSMGIPASHNQANSPQQHNELQQVPNFNTPPTTPYNSPAPYHTPQYSQDSFDEKLLSKIPIDNFFNLLMGNVKNAFQQESLSCKASTEWSTYEVHTALNIIFDHLIDCNEFNPRPIANMPINGLNLHSMTPEQCAASIKVPASKYIWTILKYIAMEMDQHLPQPIIPQIAVKQEDIDENMAFLPIPVADQNNASEFQVIQARTDHQTNNNFQFYGQLQPPVAQNPLSGASSPSYESYMVPTPGSSSVPSPETSDESPQHPATIDHEDSGGNDDDEDEVPVASSTGSGRAHIQLWQFLKELLANNKKYGSYIRWLNRSEAIFKIEDSVKVASLWGARKNRPQMNYDKLSRSIRQYYNKNIMKKTKRAQRLVYQFCEPYGQ